MGLLRIYVAGLLWPLTLPVVHTLLMAIQSTYDLEPGGVWDDLQNNEKIYQSYVL